MFKVNENVTSELVIKNSKFIGYVFYVENVYEIENILNDIKKEHKDATHICFSYILEDKEKYSDDGEPTGTAGLPITNILKMKNITNVLAIVVRYFGGIKLGAGGLIRAYSKAIRDTISKTKLNSIVYYNYYIIEASYVDQKLLNTLTSNLEIINKDFSETIKYQIKIEKSIDNIIQIFKDTNIKIKMLNL